MIRTDVNSVSEIEDIFFPKKKKDSNITSTVFKCKFCNSNRVTFKQVQTRTTDEGVTFIFTCEDCKSKWNE